MLVLILFGQINIRTLQKNSTKIKLDCFILVPEMVVMTGKTKKNKKNKILLLLVWGKGASSLWKLIEFQLSIENAFVLWYDFK